MGKNTMIRKAIRGHLQKNPNLEKLLPYIVNNVGFVFTKDDLAETRTKLLENRRVCCGCIFYRIYREFWIFRALRQRRVQLRQLMLNCHRKTPAWDLKRHRSSRHCKFRQKFLAVPSRFWYMLCLQTNVSNVFLERGASDQGWRTRRCIWVGTVEHVEYTTVQLRSRCAAGKLHWYLSTGCLKIFHRRHI